MDAVTSGDDTSADERFERLRTGICEAIAPFEVTLDSGVAALRLVPPIEMRTVQLGAVRLAWTSPAPSGGAVVRAPRHIRRSDPDRCKIDLQLRGRSVLEQDGRQLDLRAGEFGFVDLSRPCRLAGGLHQMAVVSFPRGVLPLRYRDTRALAGERFTAGEAYSGLVAAVVRQVVRRPEEYADACGVLVGDALIDLVTAALAVRLDRPAEVGHNARRRLLAGRVSAFIEDRLADPELSPAVIAAAHHISLRSLYQLFAEQGTTVASWIRARRLERCRRDLADPAMDQRPISAVAAAWGFTDPTHFGRAFKAAYGLTPSQHRRQVPAAGQIAATTVRRLVLR